MVHKNKACGNSRLLVCNMCPPIHTVAVPSEVAFFKHRASEHSQVHIDEQGKYLTTPDEKRPYRCDKCYRIYMTFGDWKSHTQSLGGNQCLYNRIQQEGKIQMFPCQVCHGLFANDRGVEQHIRNAHPDAHPDAYPEVYEFKCEDCPKSFRSEKILRTHQTKEHQREKAPRAAEKTGSFSCMLCSSVFKMKR